ncbi:MAG: NADPH-dependent FMN reductase, partial [Nannocystaceae bacterium]
ASMSFVGGARAQAHLRQVLTGMVSRLFPNPEFLVGGAHKKFDQGGNLVDESTREHLQAFMGRFTEWIRLVGTADLNTANR